MRPPTARFAKGTSEIVTKPSAGNVDKSRERNQHQPKKSASKDAVTGNYMILLQKTIDHIYRNQRDIMMVTMPDEE
ncbi:hypothetical protein INT46_006470 [Mucor plumbeus]|uniref:Uncharacterized protein n=1 Tax=Mucor plumbeus TaxID=97098 RepID=A0A8H7UZN6_9FUNG|nr:hypothetical protein INT46_006470 [Mucor plumbeus]